jgi:hypothetical protein
VYGSSTWIGWMWVPTRYIPLPQAITHARHHHKAVMVWFYRVSEGVTSLSRVMAELCCAPDLINALIERFVLVGVDLDRSDNAYLKSLLRVKGTSAVVFVKPVLDFTPGAVEWPLNCWFRPLQPPIEDELIQADLIQALVSDIISEAPESNSPGTTHKQAEDHALM